MHLSFALHLGDNGEFKGVVAKPFVYSDTIILSIPNYKKLMDPEIARVKVSNKEAVTGLLTIELPGYLRRRPSKIPAR
jgi:hypothetical protein